MYQPFKLGLLGVALLAVTLVWETSGSPLSARLTLYRAKRETPMSPDKDMGEAGNGTMSDKPTTGDKVKEVVDSAEGWLKKAGQNIKSSWDTAKDNIKSTASDVKDKVKKGINTVATKVQNATSDENESGPGNCTENGTSLLSSLVQMSTEPVKGALTTVPKNAEVVEGKCGTGDSSEEMSLSSTTDSASGDKKMKRDLFGRSNGVREGSGDSNMPEMHVKWPVIPESPSAEHSGPSSYGGYDGGSRRAPNYNW